LKASTNEKIGNERLEWSGDWEFENHKDLSHAGNVWGFNS